ncbi:MAG: glycoside hydrolase family 92 protein, partial [Lentisphaeria bacterium]|nr:glycoside hydrolase family 92 protein [Lentisphaeria bacterium]
GRTGLGDYINLGYVPEDKVLHGASRTLDFCYNDWAVSVMADHLGDTESSAKLKDRLSNYYNIWDSEQLHFRGKDSNGSWSEDFDAYRWGGAYVEGSAWQCGWAVYHEPEKLIDLIGGNEATIRRLDQMLGDQPYYETGHYPCEIHEMSEMAAMDFGQYGHNNQPSHHILYFYHLAGAPQKGNHYIHRVLDECYSHRIDGFCGDEDNGEMAAWYILNCLGLYQFCPGSTRFIKAEPYFDKISLYFDNGKTLTIERSSGHAQTTLNGEPIEMMFEYHDLRKGGQLYFE